MKRREAPQRQVFFVVVVSSFLNIVQYLRHFYKVFQKLTEHFRTVILVHVLKNCSKVEKENLTLQHNYKY